MGYLKIDRRVANRTLIHSRLKKYTKHLILFYNSIVQKALKLAHVHLFLTNMHFLHDAVYKIKYDVLIDFF